MRRFLHFWWQCTVLAAQDSVTFANNWAWACGVPLVAMVIAYIASRHKVTTVTTGSAPLDLLLTGGGAFAASWLLAFIVRLLVAPSQLYHAEKDRADHFERVRQIANGEHEPSFRLGFEMCIDEERIETYHQYKHLSSHLHETICRVSVENVDAAPIENCRLVIEHMGPRSPVRDGALLIQHNDHRITSEVPLFNLSASETKYFSFLGLESEYETKELVVTVRTDAGRGSLMRILDLPALEYGRQYFVTLAAHGDGANSARLNLMIHAISEMEIIISEGRDRPEKVKKSQIL